MAGWMRSPDDASGALGAHTACMTITWATTSDVRRSGRTRRNTWFQIEQARKQRSDDIRALTSQGTRKVSVETIPDLHLGELLATFMGPGDIVGLELMERMVEAGSGPSLSASYVSTALFLARTVP